MINSLAKRLKALRMQNGYSQRAVAEKLDVSPSIISGYETGERTPSAEMLLALSYLYHCSTDYLLGKDAEQPKNMICVDGLTAKQIQAITELIRTMQT